MGTRVKGLRKWGYIFVGPGLLWFLLFMLIPMIDVIRLSFVKYIPGGSNVFIGIKNYKDILLDHDFWRAFLHTFEFVGIILVIVIPLSLVIAIFLAHIKRGAGFFRALYYMPSVMGVVAIGIIWQWVFTARFGLIDNFCNLVGWKTINWWNTATPAKTAIIIVKVWMRLGFSVILFLAAILNVPKELYEAARVDGVSFVKQQIYITVPMIMPIMTLLIVLTTIDILQMFGEIFMLSKGGPAGATSTIGYLMYNTAFRYMDMGKASAMGLILLLVVLLITAFQRKVLDKNTTTL